MFKEALSIKELREKIEKLQMLEDWHEEMLIEHHQDSEKARTKRRALKTKLSVAERDFINNALKD